MALRKTDTEYRNSMDFPMTNLAMEIFGGSESDLSDAEIVELATKKIRMLKEMILATGFKKELLDACMRN